MEYREFIDTITLRIKNILGEEAAVSVHKVIKNNGIKYDGLAIRLLDDYMSPVIYLNDYYTEDADDRKLNDIAYDIISFYQMGLINNDIDLELLKNYECIQDKIVFKIINYDVNKELLEGVPHIKFLDLAAVCYCILNKQALEDIRYKEVENFTDNKTITISNEFLDLWNISKEQLFDNAIKNTEKRLPLTLETIEDILMKELGGLDKALFEELFGSVPENVKIPMYVMSNIAKLNGAASMFYKNAISDFSEAVLEDLYIVPSSIHEIILIPRKKNITKENLLETISDVNTSCVNEDEILSYNLYYYSRDDNTITIL